MAAVACLIEADDRYVLRYLKAVQMIKKIIEEKELHV